MGWHGSLSRRRADAPVSLSTLVSDSESAKDEANSQQLTHLEVLRRLLLSRYSQQLLGRGVVRMGVSHLSRSVLHPFGRHASGGAVIRSAIAAEDRDGRAGREESVVG